MTVDVVELARTLIAIPSESGRSNVPAMDALAEVLDSCGFSLRRYAQAVDPQGEPKVNMVAERGHGPRRLVFSGHIDTVPVGDESLWSHDPYGGDGICDGRLYGRGSVDMKGQVAAMASAIAAGDEVLDRLTLVLAVTADEEIGHLGVKSLASQHVFEDAVGAVVGEPTNLSVIHAHKGALTVRVDVRGISCHSSRPELGVNAIAQAMRLVEALEDDMADWRALRHPSFGDEPPTFAIVGISGGIAHNIVPDLCTLEINVRGVVQEHLEAFMRILSRTIARLREEDTARGLPPERRFSAEVTPLTFAPPMYGPADGPWQRLAMEVAEQKTPQFVRYGTDGGVLSMVGLPCVVWGPGDIARAHTTDEYITVEELHAGVRRYGELIARVAEADLPTVTTRLWEEPIRST